MNRLWVRGGTVLAAMAAIAGLGWWFTARLGVPGEAVLSTPVAAANLPGGAVLLDAAGASAVRAPFRLVHASGAGGGRALGLPEGAKSTDQSGGADFTFSVSTGATFHTWVRACWSDSCGNSVGVAVDDLPRYTAGQDDVYGAWHWVRAGEYRLEAGPHRLSLQEREDGVSVDQVLLVPDAAFAPSGAIRTNAVTVGVRRFADSFSRSPGHGLGSWEPVSGRWEIAFSLDPNRIPLQYALTGTPDGTNPAAILLGREGSQAPSNSLGLADAPWAGAVVAISVWPGTNSGFAVLLPDVERAGPGQAVWFRAGDTGAQVGVAGGASATVTGRLRADQWHRVRVLRWAWFLRVEIDGQPVLEDRGLPEWRGGVGLGVDAGRVAFDDVEVEEALWQAEDGVSQRLPWNVSADARWYRQRSGGLTGRRGRLTAALAGLPVAEALAEGADGAWRTLPGAAAVVLDACAGPVSVRRVGVRYAEPRDDACRLGPYHFTQPQIEDPSDYLDFTPEELRQIAGDPGKLRRQAKFVPLVGRERGEGCLWQRESGDWWVGGGLLQAAGPRALLRYRDEFHGTLEVRLRVALPTAGSCAGLLLDSPLDTGKVARVRLGACAALPQPPNCVAVELPTDGTWHDVCIRSGADGVSVSVDRGAPRRLAVAQPPSRSLALGVVAGQARFDDVEIAIPRAAAGERYSAFDRQETDWWRAGGAWVDHGGIACVPASNWLSLVAPGGDGMAWSKQRFRGDLLVAFDVLENSEWHGWDRSESHTHHPFDNIRVVLGTEARVESGYRLEVNARGRTATVLYREGREVAAVPQDRNFPARYVGGHAPYAPRRMHVMLMKTGATVTAAVNGEVVLRYTDAMPIAVSAAGFGGERTRANFSGVIVRELR